MSRLLAKIMLALLMLPLGVGAYILIASVLFEVWDPGESAVFYIAGTSTAVLVAGYWTLLWRSTVRWTPRRITLSVLAAIPALACGWVVGSFGGSTVDPSFGSFVSCPIFVLVWLFLTVLIWRETPAEHASRIRGSTGNLIVCPQCGYNMTGLIQATCPECGANYSIEELVASQPSREHADLDA